MADENVDQKQKSLSPAEIGRQLIGAAATATLATIDRKTGGPSASLIALATLDDNTPLFLISTLAEHTANLQADPRASILLDGTRELDDPLTGPRLTLIGKALPFTGAPTAARSRYLAHHPGAEVYVDFADFEFYVFKALRAHYVGGFGRIAAIPVENLKHSSPA